MRTPSPHADAQQLRALAALLEYPEPGRVAHYADLVELLGAFDPVDARRPELSLRRFLLDALRDDPLQLQARYVDTFDRGRSTSLNLFEQVHGDSRDRGQAMVDLLGQYREAGLELDGRELPDYLPVYLEYVSVLEPQAARDALADIALLLCNLADALERRDAAWLPVLALLCRLAGVDDWRKLLAETRRRDGARAAPAADWSAQALDDAWAEQPVEFAGACAPNGARVPQVQPMQFVAPARRDATPGA